MVSFPSRQLLTNTHSYLTFFWLRTFLKKSVLHSLNELAKKYSNENYSFSPLQLSCLRWKKRLKRNSVFGTILLIKEKRAHSFVQRTMKTKKHRGKASDDGGEKHLVLMRNSAFNNNCLCAAFGWCLTLSGWRPQFLLTSAKKHCDISTKHTTIVNL